jgi:phospho-N-acetylmuramoyl-pentapeptide-transferase
MMEGTAAAYGGVSLVLRGAAVCIISWSAARLAFKPYIRFAQRHRLGQEIREDGPAAHEAKQGTPTMGGLVIIIVAAAAALPVIRWNEPGVLVLLLALLLFSAVGLADDLLKIRKRRSEGLRVSQKLGLQAAAAAAVAVGTAAVRPSGGEFSATSLFLPWNMAVPIELGGWYYLCAGLFLVYFVNAVNLADGLDGLAGGLSVLLILFLTLLAGVGLVLAGGDGSGGRPEMTVLLLGMLGALAAFLRFNRRPAQVFMGDVGSQGLGGLIGASALILRAELLVFAAGAVFLMEFGSVILQVASFKLFGRRIFRMAPLHHHYELKGLSERSVVVRFWTAGAVSAAAVLFFYVWVLGRSG